MTFLGGLSLTILGQFTAWFCVSTPLLHNRQQSFMPRFARQFVDRPRSLKMIVDMLKGYVRRYFCVANTLSVLYLRNLVLLSELHFFNRDSLALSVIVVVTRSFHELRFISIITASSGKLYVSRRWFMLFAQLSSA